MQINLTHKKLTAHEPFVLHGETHSAHQIILVSLMEDKGRRIGLGECAPLRSVSCDGEAYIHTSDAARLIEQALKSDDYTEPLRNYPALLFALESAMYDYQQNPVLYDTPFAHSQQPLLTVLPITGDTAEVMLANVKKGLLAGFRHMKLSLGNTTWEEIVALLEKVRSRFSKDHLMLRLDACGKLSAEDAMAKIEVLQSLGVSSVEQPLPRYKWKETAELCAKSPVRIALGDELTGVNSMAEKAALLDTIRPAAIAITPMLHGGITGSMEWAHLANERGIAFWLCACGESNIGWRNVSLLAARLAPAAVHDLCIPSYMDNIEMDIEMRKSKVWRCEVDE